MAEEEEKNTKEKKNTEGRPNGGEAPKGDTQKERVTQREGPKKIKDQRGNNLRQESSKKLKVKKE